MAWNDRQEMRLTLNGQEAAAGISGLGSGLKSLTLS
jgi:hypothetical protein